MKSPKIKTKRRREERRVEVDGWKIRAQGKKKEKKILHKK